MRQGGDLGNIEPGKNSFPFGKAAKYLAVGLEFPSTIIGGLFLGYFLDLYWDTSPWFTTALTLLALVGAFIRLVQCLKRFSDQEHRLR